MIDLQKQSQEECIHVFRDLLFFLYSFFLPTEDKSMKHKKKETKREKKPKGYEEKEMVDIRVQFSKKKKSKRDDVD